MQHVDAEAAQDNAMTERRDGSQRGNRLLGRIVACNGSRAVVTAVASAGETDVAQLWSVGRLISIKVGENRVVALVYAMDTKQDAWIEGQDNIMRFEVELVGEIRTREDGRPHFSAGITNYPYLGAIAHRMRADDLRAIYDIEKSNTAVIGKLTQDRTMDAIIHVPSMLQRHFAIVGTTGVGKSSAVALLLNKVIEADQQLRVMILDPHNEFAAAFPETSIVVDTDTLELPFWLFRLEEFVEVIFRGRPGVPEEVDVLRDLIPEAKRNFRGAADNAFFRRSTDKSTLTADTPVPYRIADLLALIDERIGRLDGRNEKPYLRQLKSRVSSAINDPRFHFMFFSNTINDTLAETIGRLFRIPGNGQPITTFQLSGIPSEVVNSVASVLCRMAFEIALWSNGGVRILVVCEEAHRYVPADPTLGFVPTRQAIARIAKEGRKYGVSLGVVTQRPGELDPTILSQCSTVFAMRLSNEHDQEIIRSAIPDSSTSTTSFLSSIGNGEAIAFGEAIAVPMRMRFSKLDKSQLPKANSNLTETVANADDVDLRTIVQGMRALSSQENAAAGPETSARPQPGDNDPYQRPLASPAPGASATQADDREERRGTGAPAPGKDRRIAEGNRAAPGENKQHDERGGLVAADGSRAPGHAAGRPDIRSLLLRRPHRGNS